MRVNVAVLEAETIFAFVVQLRIYRLYFDLTLTMVLVEFLGWSTSVNGTDETHFSRQWVACSASNLCFSSYIPNNALTASNSARMLTYLRHINGIGFVFTCSFCSAFVTLFLDASRKFISNCSILPGIASRALNDQSHELYLRYANQSQCCLTLERQNDLSLRSSCE